MTRIFRESMGISYFTSVAWCNNLVMPCLSQYTGVYRLRTVDGFFMLV
jgi:hypothetical protein